MDRYPTPVQLDARFQQALWPCEKPPAHMIPGSSEWIYHGKAYRGDNPRYPPAQKSHGDERIDTTLCQALSHVLISGEECTVTTADLHPRPKHLGLDHALYLYSDDRALEAWAAEYNAATSTKEPATTYDDDMAVLKFPQKLRETCIYHYRRSLHYVKWIRLDDQRVKECYLWECELHSSRVELTVFKRRCTIEDSRLQDCEVDGAEPLRGTELRGCTVKISDLDDCQIDQGSRILASNLRSCRAASSEIGLSQLQGCTVKGSDVHDVWASSNSFRKCNIAEGLLSGCRIESSKITISALWDCILADSTLSPGCFLKRCSVWFDGQNVPLPDGEIHRVLKTNEYFGEWLARKQEVARPLGIAYRTKSRYFSNGKPI